MSTELRPTPEVNTHRDDMDHCEFDEELALTYELAKKLERERDEARDQLEALREAIKEATHHLQYITNANVASLSAKGAARHALDKLQPFLKP